MSFTGKHRRREPALFPRLRRTLVAFHRVGIAVVAGVAVFCGDKVGADTLRHEIRRNRNRGIDRPRTAVGPHRYPAHGFHAAADHEGRLTGHHLGRRHVHGFQPARAKAVDLHAGHVFAIACRKHRRARDVRALLADRRDAAQDHILHVARVEAGVAFPKRGQYLRGETYRRHLVQRAVFLAFAAHGAHVVIDVGVGHGFLVWKALASIMILLVYAPRMFSGFEPNFTLIQGDRKEVRVTFGLFS